MANLNNLQDAWAEDNAQAQQSWDNEVQPIDLDTGGSTDAEKRALTFNSKGIYIGENLDILHEFVHQTEVDASILDLQNQINALPQTSNTYTISQVDSLLDDKANAAETYTKSQTYSKAELEVLLNDKPNSNDTFTQIQSYKNFLKILDLPISINPAVQAPVITDLNAGTQNPFGQDAFAWTQAQYDLLSDDEKLNNKLYFIVDGTTEELLGSTKPTLASNQVKAVASGQKLELNFSLVPQTELTGETTDGTLEINGSQAIFTAPIVSNNTTIVLTFHGKRNNLLSLGLKVGILVFSVPANNKVITFDTNGGTGTMAEETIALSNGSASYTLPDCSFKPPFGMEFKGWSTSTTDTTKFLGTSGETVNFTSADTITLYAIWQTSSNRNVVIYYNANGGSGSMETIHTVLGTYTMPLCNFAPPENKEFAMWAENSVGTYGQVLPQSEVVFNVAREVTFYAIWKSIGEDILIKPDTPVLKVGYAAELTEGQSGLYEFTNIDGNLKIDESSVYNNNSVAIYGNVIKITAEYGSVNVGLVVYQTSLYGVNSDKMDFVVKIIEANPDALELDSTNTYKVLVGDTLILKFTNANYPLEIVNASAQGYAAVDGDTIKISSLTAQDLVLSVSQVKTARDGTLKKSDPISINVSVVTSL